MTEERVGQGTFESNIADEMARGSRLHLNIGQDLIIITEDKAYRCINEHKNLLEQETAWIAPLGIFLTLIVALITSDFRQVLFLSADVWKAAFLLATVVIGVWLIRTIPAAFRKKKASITALLAELKKFSGQSVAPDSNEVGSNTKQMLPKLQPSMAVPSPRHEAKWKEITSKIQLELLKEIREDLKRDPTQREFTILPNPNIRVYAEFKGQKFFVYHQTSFQNLNSQLSILEKYGCVKCIDRGTSNKPPRYFLDEEFVEMLNANL